MTTDVEPVNASSMLCEPAIENDCDILAVLEGVVTFHEQWHLVVYGNAGSRGRMLLAALIDYRDGDATKLNSLLKRPTE